MNELAGWLRARSRSVRGYLALTVGLGEFAGILLIVQTALLVRIGNGVIFEHDTLASLTLSFVLLFATIIVRSIVGWASRRAGFACSGSVKHQLRRELLRHIGSVAPVRLAGEHAGELSNTLVDAVEALDGYYARYLPQRAIASLLPLTVLAVVFPLDWISGITLLVTAIFIPIMMILIGEDAHERNQRLWGRLSQMSARFLDTLQGITTLKIFDAARREAGVIEELSEDYRRSTMSVMRIAFVSALMLELISTVSIAIVAIASGLRMLAGHMPFAPGYFILLVAPEYFLTLRNLGTYYHSRMEAVSAAEHIVRVLELPAGDEPRPTATSAAGLRRDPGAVGSEASHGSQSDATQRGPAGGPSRVSFRSVSYRYASDRGEVLRDIDLAIAPGEHVYIVGRSGEGKSTLLSLLLGFIQPQTGRVELDGWDSSRWAPDERFARIAWLPQRPTIFHGTIAENIALGLRDADPAEIELAAHRAYADEFIERFPLGYATPVGERGRGLSGGQVQRIALARLFLRAPTLVLLDEPTAHLDAESEAKVRTSIDRLAEDRTLLTVTHRLESIDPSGRVYALRSGRLVAESVEHLRLAANGPAAREGELE